MNQDLLTDTVSEWLQGLDYEFMVLHIIVCYGLYYSNNWKWVWMMFAPVRSHGVSKGVWLIGGVLAVIEMLRFIPYVGEGGLDYQKFISVLHSYIVVQVFVEPLVTTVHKWLGVIKNNGSAVSDSKGKKKERS